MSEEGGSEGSSPSETEQPITITEEEKKRREEENLISSKSSEIVEENEVNDENAEVVTSAEDSNSSTSIPKRKRSDSNENRDSSGEIVVNFSNDIISISNNHSKRVRIDEEKNSTTAENAVVPSNVKSNSLTWDETDEEGSTASGEVDLLKKINFPVGNSLGQDVVVQGAVWSHLFAIGKAFQSLSKGNPPTETAKTKPIYGQLISNSGQPDITINAEEFVVGRHPKCHVLLKDPIFPNHLFQITCSGGTLLLEALHSNPVPFVYHNSNLLKKGVKVELKPMDQLTINGTRKLIYNVRVNRSNNNSASSSSSLSNNNNANSVATVPNSSKASESSSSTRNRLFSSIFPSGSSKRETSSSSERDSKKDTNEELKEKFKEYFKKRFFGEKQEEEGKEKVTFETFPYYLSDNTKQILIHSAFMHLSKQEYLKFVNNLPISKKILLSGPQGTEIYQELLVKALSNHFNATLITLDAEIMESAISECVPTPPSVAEGAERDRSDDLLDDDLDDYDTWPMASKRLKSAKKALNSSKDRSSSSKSKEESNDKEKGKSEGSSSSNNNNSLPSSKPLSSSSSRSSSSKSHADPFAKADKLLMSSNYMMNPYRMFGERKESGHSSEPKQLQM